MIADAKTRFTLVGRDKKGNALRGSAETAKKYSDRWFVYVCPVCKTETAFEWNDFVRHAGKSFSKLIASHEQAIGGEAAGRLKNENAFIDFYCTGCHSFARAYYYYEPPQDRQSEWLTLKTIRVDSRQESFLWRSKKLGFSVAG
jgi:hypothetical protein